MSLPCPCRSGLMYSACCEPLHLGVQEADSAEALMRSRYSAFAQAKAQYLVDTWAEERRPALEELTADLKAQVERGERWVALKVLSAQGAAGDEEGAVAFEASLISGAQLITLTEVSRFIRAEGAWRYLEGNPQINTRKLGRNERCPCGSGQKVKRCCA